MSESENQTKTVLVTGSSKGVGRAVAEEFARRGYRVASTARDPQTLADLDVAHRLRLDVTDQASIDAAVAEVGGVDVLVSNAGNIFLASVEASPPVEIERLFAQNTVGAIRVAQAVLPGMRARGSGRLLFMSSVTSRVLSRRTPRTPRPSGPWRRSPSRSRSRPRRSGCTPRCSSPAP